MQPVGYSDRSSAKNCGYTMPSANPGLGTYELMCGTETVEIALPKLQALVYNILPSTTAIFSYAIGSRKLSANEQFFVGAQTVAQTTQIISDVCFVTDHVAYASSNKTRIV